MSRETPLHRALVKSELDFEEIKNCLDQDSSWVHELDDCSRTPLMLLLENDNCTADIVRLLLHYQEGVNDGNVLITALIQCRNEDIIEALLEKKGANLDDFQGDSSPLCHALCGVYPKCVIEMLLNAGCSTNACRFHPSALHCAIYSEAEVDVLELLLKKGVDMKSVVKRKQSLLCYALQHQAGIDEIALLLNADSSFRACKKHGTLWQCVTLHFVSLAMVECIHNACISVIDKVDDDDNTPLQRVLLYSTYETRAIKFLLNQHVDMYKVRSKKNDTLLHTAVKNNNCKPSAVKHLIDRGCRVDQVNDEGEIPLHLAVTNEFNFLRPTIVAVLLRNGSPVNAKDNSGRTPLRSLSFNCRDADVLKMLLVAGAHIEVRRDEQGPPLLTDLLFEYDLTTRISYHQFTGKLLTCVKLLIKYSFIKNPNFDIEPFIQEREDYETFLDFASTCVRELQEMESKDIGQGRSLLEFLSRIPDAANFEAEDYDFNQLLRMRADNVFPIYFDIIAAKVGRLLMKTKLEEMLVYTVKNHDESACLEKKVILNYESVCEIAPFLSDEDLLRLSMAFYNSNDNAASGCAGKRKICAAKRSPEQSAELRKRAKFDN